MPDEPVAPVETPTDETPTYRMGQWSGVPQYTCLDCGAQSFHLDRMAAHRREAHDGRMVVLPDAEAEPAHVVIVPEDSTIGDEAPPSPPAAIEEESPHADAADVS